jgi:hypothetical protein
MTHIIEQKEKKAKKNKTKKLIVLLLILTNLTTFSITSNLWLHKYIEAERRAKICVPMLPNASM